MIRSFNHYDTVYDNRPKPFRKTTGVTVCRRIAKDLRVKEHGVCTEPFF
ncbi:MAG: hypothetical protein JRI93_15685 [Deltaproteobacteria bacterium]|nr:hypothetical protein [Deltaproteobacteria bacterium]